MLRSRIRPPKPPKSRPQTRPPTESGRSKTSPDDTRQEESLTARDVRPSFDWKGWIVLAWVLWFGMSYGKMVLTQRSDKISSLVARLVKSI